MLFYYHSFLFLKSYLMNVAIYDTNIQSRLQDSSQIRDIISTQHLYFNIHIFISRNAPLIIITRILRLSQLSSKSLMYIDRHTYVCCERSLPSSGSVIHSHSPQTFREVTHICALYILSITISSFTPLKSLSSRTHIM